MVYLETDFLISSNGNNHQPKAHITNINKNMCESIGLGLSYQCL